jgi:hypothetical protein
MVAGRILQLDAEQWATAQEQAREGGSGTAVGTALADNLDAPVRATWSRPPGDAALPRA